MPQSDSLAAIRLFCQLESWNPKVPPPSDRGINHAWNATPNAIVTDSGLLADEDDDAPAKPRARTKVVAAIVPDKPGSTSVPEPPSPSKTSVSNADPDSVRRDTSRLLYEVVDRETPRPPGPRATYANKSPPPSPKSAPTILDSEGESKFRFYHAMLETEAGVANCLRSLIGFGIYQADVQFVAQLVHRLTFNRSDNLRVRFRIEALNVFRSYWRQDGPWWQEVPVFNPYVSSHGVNIAAFMGSLYRVGLLNSNEVHRFLDVLLCTDLHYVKLLAAHALFIQCGDRICAGTSASRTEMLKKRISERRPDGRFVWGPNEESHVLILDLLDHMERWFAIQAVKRLRAEQPDIVCPGDTPRNTPDRSGRTTPTQSKASPVATTPRGKTG
ncbi:hypothetical protein B0H15DRAFT_837084 [Mycena belliarum]|uniref:Uncharacterized protein n=1 Tax=Mycena belliarum TaxID=1033014 RepID=A0AAD6U5L6_9AGAR|nr:hypothetical protein B0H15DRAFT_837084 [Mycena belliae]